MPNVSTMFQLESAAQYEGEGVARAAALLKQYAPWFEQQSDNLERAVFSAQTATIAQVTDSAANVYGIFIMSPAAATVDVIVQVFNGDDTDVTVGTTDPVLVLTCPATEDAVWLHVPGSDSKNLFSAGVSLAATTTFDGNTSVAAASRPDIWVLYAD